VFDEIDIYQLSLEEGTFLTAEVISEVISFSADTISNQVITRLALLRQEPNDEVTLIDANYQTFERFDPWMFDVETAETGTYVVVVAAPNEVFIDTDGDGIYDARGPLDDQDFFIGDYLLLLYHFRDESPATTIAPPTHLAQPKHRQH
jgi:hypothetical protein